MPHYYQFYTTFKENEERLTIKSAVANMNIPFLIVHGDQDETVPMAEAENVNQWNEGSLLRVIQGANHTFGSSQPWNENALPKHLKAAIDETLEFLQT